MVGVRRVGVTPDDPYGLDGLPGQEEAQKPASCVGELEAGRQVVDKEAVSRTHDLERGPGAVRVLLDDLASAEPSASGVEEPQRSRRHDDRVRSDEGRTPAVEVGGRLCERSQPRVSGSQIDYDEHRSRRDPVRTPTGPVYGPDDCRDLPVADLGVRNVVRARPWRTGQLRSVKDA